MAYRTVRNVMRLESKSVHSAKLMVRAGVVFSVCEAMLGNMLIWQVQNLSI